MDLPAEKQSAHDMGIKLEEPDVEVLVLTQGIGSGSQRESSGHDPHIFDGEDEQ